MTNDFIQTLLILGEEKNLVGVSKQDTYKREFLLSKVFVSLFNEEEEVLELTKALNELIVEAALAQISLFHLIAKKIPSNNFPSFICKNLDRWYLSLNYVTGRNPELITFLESRLPPDILKVAEIKADEIIREELRINYDFNPRKGFK